MIDALPLPFVFHSRAGESTLRRARLEDADAVIALLADDAISATRGDVASPDDRPLYVAACERVLAAAGNDLLVIELDGIVVGTLQLTVVPGMARRGALRLLVEAVRVNRTLRSSGIGSAAMRWVTGAAAPALGVAMVQLTSDATRTDAHRFYENLGFEASHLGFKFVVSSGQNATA